MLASMQLRFSLAEGACHVRTLLFDRTAGSPIERGIILRRRDELRFGVINSVIRSPNLRTITTRRTDGSEGRGGRAGTRHP